MQVCIHVWRTAQLHKSLHQLEQVTGHLVRWLVFVVADIALNCVERLKMLFELGVLPDSLQNLPLLRISDPFEEFLRFTVDVCV